MRALPPALLAISLLAGCLGPAEERSEAEHRLSGTFLGTAFPDELSELRLVVLENGGEFSTTSRIPPTFLASGLSASACKAVRDFAATRTYLEALGGCEPLDESILPVPPAPVPVLVSAPIG